MNEGGPYIIPRRGSKVRGNGSARYDAVRALRKAVESFFALFKGGLEKRVMGRKRENIGMDFFLGFSVMDGG